MNIGAGVGVGFSNPREEPFFEYQESQACQNGSDVTPIINNPGGTFSSSPTGLSINSSTGVIDVSASTAGTYTVTYSIGPTTDTITILPADNSSFSYSASSFRENASNPAPTITGLVGGVFSAPAGIIFTDVNSNTGSSSGIINLSASTIGGPYTITYTTTGNCPTSSTFDLSIQVALSITYSAAAFCEDGGNTAAPTVVGDPGSGSFASSPAGLTVNSSNGVINTDTSTPGDSNPYTITYTASTGETATAQVTIKNLPNIIITPNPSLSVCDGSSATLTASGGVSYLWSNSSTQAQITVSSSGTYSVTGTGSNGCQNTASAAFTVNPLPTISISASSTSICAGDSVTLTASGGTSYLWGGGQTVNPLTVTPGATTTFSVTGTDSNGCQNTADQQITVTAVDVATVTYSAASYCQMPTGALAVDGYYPLYSTESAAQAESSDGTAHAHTLSGTTYYMPNDGVTIYHGTYSLTTPAPTITGQSGTFTAAPLFTGLLDTYTGSEAAYSLRRLSSTYTGNLIRVTKKVSNVISTTDIGYNSSNELDTAALATFASGADSGEVRVDIWYDQSGNGNNVTQSSFTGCPYIYQSGSLITENSKPAIKNGGNIALETTNSPFNSQVLTSFMVNKYYTTSNYHVLLTIGNSNASSFRFFNNNNYGNWRANGLNVNGTSGDLDIQNLTSAYNTTTNLYARYNGSQFGTASGTAGAFTSSEIRIGKNLANANQNFIGTYQEFIFYSSEQSSNMSGIETNINNYYSIY